MGRGDPIWEYFNRHRERRVGELPIDDLIAIIRGSGMDRPIDTSNPGVPGLLGPNTPTEVSGNWGRQSIIKYAPTAAETNAGFMQQAPLLALDGANRRPCAITIDVFPAANVQGTTTFPAGTDTSGNLLSYRSQAVLSYGVSYGQVGFRSDQIFFDVGRGQRVTIVANMAYLSALMLAPPTGYTSGSMSVGAVMCVNDAATYAPPIVTSFIDALATGGSIFNYETVVIPPRCNLLLPVQSSNVTGQIQLDFQDNASQTLFSLRFGNGSQVAPIPLCGAYQVKLTNRTLNTTTNYSLPFQLSN